MAGEPGSQQQPKVAEVAAPAAAGTGARPPLAVAIPTYQRPDRLAVALESVLAQLPSAGVEVVVSDNSTDARTEAVCTDLAQRYGRPVRYQRHVPGLGMNGNFDACVRLSSAEHVLILHDDDHLLPGAVAEMLASIETAPGADVRLFGVHVVTPEGKVLRRQKARHRRHLPPREALHRLMTRSSFVRFPGMVVSRRAYEDVGDFDPTVGGPSDVDMWARLFARYGLLWEPAVTAAYLVHEDAATTKVFTPETIASIDRMFASAGAHAGLAPEEISRWSAHWYHQFILAAAVRALRAGDRGKARAALQLFQTPQVEAAGPSGRWLPLRLALTALTAGAASEAAPSR